MASSIEAGTSLAHYRVLGPLGAGGMGEVYKAHDTRLERTVALKVLPPEMVRNEERRRRFVQEAKSASSLNHPHLITIHDIGVAVPSNDGNGEASDVEPIHYIAMELVDGTTLGTRIHAEKVPLRTLLGYLAQAADGLAKAHAAGIIHRDLKPENIMVTRDGFAKVLDFGLAKLSPTFSATDPTIESPRERTREGTLLGTVAYMSPEQVQGKEVDHRSDIFSFGSILYEAATRRRPFSADSDIELMHKILHDKPLAVDEIDPTVPSEVRRVIRRCMAKDPEKRYQSMKDLALELRDIADEYDDLSMASGSRGSSSTPTAITPVAPRKPWMWIAAGALVLAVLVAIGVFVGKRAGNSTVAAASAAVPSNDVEMRRLTSTGRVYDATISPDGRYVAYVNADGSGSATLRIRQIATGSDVIVEEPSPLSYAGLAFSPDGNYLYYSRTDPEDSGYAWLYQVPTLGGTARKVLHDVDTPVSFSPDGKQFVFGRGLPGKGENHVLIANADGSGERLLVAQPRVFGVTAPAWAPDGKTIATIVQIPPVGRFAKTVLVDVATGASRDFGSTNWWWIEDIAWTHDGNALLMAAMHEERGLTHVWRQPFPEGNAIRLTSDLNRYRDISTTVDGKVVATIATDEKSELRIGDPSNANAIPVSREPARGVGAVSTSATGAIVYEVHSERAGQTAILDAPDAQPRVLTDESMNVLPAISGDGRTIAFTSDRDQKIGVYAIGADGTGLRRVTAGEGEVLDDVSPDGTMIAYKMGDALWVMPLQGGKAHKLSDRARSITRAVFSTDSKSILYEQFQISGGTTSVVIRIVPLAGGTPVREIPWRGPRAYSWARHPEGFTFVTAADGGRNVFLLPEAGGEPRPLTKFTSTTIRSHAWLPDGRLVLVHGDESSDVVLLTGF